MVLKQLNTIKMKKNKGVTTTAQKAVIDEKSSSFYYDACHKMVGILSKKYSSVEAMQAEEPDVYSQENWDFYKLHEKAMIETEDLKSDEHEIAYLNTDKEGLAMQNPVIFFWFEYESGIWASLIMRGGYECKEWESFKTTKTTKMEQEKSGNMPYSSLDELIKSQPDLQNYCGYVPYTVRSIEKLLGHNIEVTDCSYSVFRGSNTKLLPSQFEDDEPLNECDFMFVIYNKGVPLMDIYYDVAEKDGSHKLSMLLYSKDHQTNIECTNMTGEMAEYINILLANRSGMHAMDKHIKNAAKFAVYNIEMWIHSALRKGNIIDDEAISAEMPSSDISKLPSNGSYGIGNVDDLLANL